MNCLELTDITYTYPLMKTPSIQGVNLQLESGKVYALMGENGSGKTTLCNVIRGFIPDFFKGKLEGEVRLEGVPLQEYTTGELAKKIGYLFQNPFNQITGARDNVYEEIAYGLENFGVPVELMKKKIDQVLKMTNLTELKEKNPFELSGGQQQRVAFASVLVLEPDIFVIDEPTSQLDPVESERIFEIILKLKKMGKTILLVEHKSELLAEYADEVIVLSEGKVILAGEKHEVLFDKSLMEQGISLPQAVLLSQELERRGIKLKRKCITRKELEEQLQKEKKHGGY